jgi:hypothetical protein
MDDEFNGSEEWNCVAERLHMLARETSYYPWLVIDRQGIDS